MNCARARCRRAIGPRMRAKRAPESLAAVSKSNQPCRSPRATWSLTSKSKVFGVPQRRTSTLASSSAPTGTDSCGRLGMPSSMASSSPWMASSWRLPSSSSEPMRSTSASSGAMSSPRCLAWPIALGARCARPAVARYGSVPTCAALPALRCARHPVGSHGWPGGQPLLAAGCVPVWDRACSFLVSCRLSAVRGPVGASPAPATSSTPSRKPG